ncbi:MAG: RNA polymerase sigma factor [Polyangiaceae bacterium]
MWKTKHIPHTAEPLTSQWFLESADYIRRSLRRLGVPGADLEDAVQETLIAVHRRRDSYDDSRPLKPWLFGFALRVAANQRRKTRLDHAVSDELASEDASPEHQALLGQARRIVGEVLDHMPRERREVFSLYVLQGLSAPEIARLISAPTNTVYSRLRTARAEFARGIHERTAPALGA